MCNCPCADWPESILLHLGYEGSHERQGPVHSIKGIHPNSFGIHQTIEITLKEGTCPFGNEEEEWEANHSYHHHACHLKMRQVDGSATLRCNGCGKQSTFALDRTHRDTFEFLNRFWGNRALDQSH